MVTAKKAKEKSSAPPKKPAADLAKLYELNVYLYSGPYSEEYAEKVICRTIEMLGSHTLQDLHALIFMAFDREEEHLWEFQIGGKGLDDPKNKRYGPPELEDDEAMDAGEATLDSLKLKEGQPFGYVFDFGDNWEHQINVVKIGTTDNRMLKPKVVKTVGKAPPQYGDEE